MAKCTSDQGKKEGPDPLTARTAMLLTPVPTGGAKLGSSANRLCAIPSLLFLCELHSVFYQEPFQNKGAGKGASPHSTCMRISWVLPGGMERGQKRAPLGHFVNFLGFRKMMK